MMLNIVILAAGQGTRMHSDLPKVLHQLAGIPLLEHVVNTAHALKPNVLPMVIFGHQGAIVRHQLAHLTVNWIEQKEQLGTGHALLQALPELQNDNRVLVLYGDVPLITVETLKHFIKETPENQLGIITSEVKNPEGLGRIIRDDTARIIEITEEKDATETIRAIKEINTGIYLVPEYLLQKWLPRLTNHNAQKEFYLPDIIKMAVQDKINIYGYKLSSDNSIETMGINDRLQLASAERFYQKRIAENLMRKGVTILDPARFDVRGNLKIGKDVTIDINVILEGNVQIGNNCIIGPNVYIRNCLIKDNVEIKAHSVLDGGEIASHCMIGPFARIRPGSVLAQHAHVGNFVEIKNSLIGMGSKINHLSYIGDSEIGKTVNVGAGTITCNYDGINKHRTIIEDDAFIGSNTELVAPITVGKGATIGAGSTITRNAPPHKLTVARAKQCTIENWKRPTKEEN